jgi:hypothetical protein
LGSVIRNDSLWHPELCDDIFPQEAFGINILDIHQRFGLNLFGEVVRGDNKKSFVP